MITPQHQYSPGLYHKARNILQLRRVVKLFKLCKAGQIFLQHRHLLHRRRGGQLLVLF